MYVFFPSQHFASDIRTQKAVIFGSFFITFLYSGFGNSLLCKFHRALSTATLSICVLYLYTEPYLLGGRKPQEPRKVHAILFLTSASSDTSGSWSLVCGQNLGWYHCFYHLISNSSPREYRAWRTALAFSPRIPLWVRTDFPVGETDTL